MTGDRPLSLAKHDQLAASAEAQRSGRPRCQTGKHGTTSLSLTLRRKPCQKVRPKPCQLLETTCAEAPLSRLPTFYARDSATMPAPHQTSFISNSSARWRP